ncbi:MAG: formate/nitrite transporter family protein [Endomicrobium sp.]|jgi:formate/nitrite transporter|nr:formate/nitrite transporter family protein [Endomicrobium sp.]
MRNLDQTVESLISVSWAKAHYRPLTHALLAVLAGIYIGFGAALAIRVTGNLSPELGNLTKLLFGLLFPVGLLLVLMAGASLFTGDVMFVSALYFKKEIGAIKLIKFLAFSYVGNFIGSVFLAFMIVYSGVFQEGSGHPIAISAINIANAKTALPFSEAFLRGILCNWLVCLAIYMSLTSDDAISKIFLMWPPITAFVALGMEHSVANMFFIPLGILLGNTPEISLGAVKLSANVKTFLVDNLIPVTLGNIVGAVFFVTLPYLLASNTKDGSKI